jgi:hypothetical protein
MFIARLRVYLTLKPDEDGPPSIWMSNITVVKFVLAVCRMFVPKAILGVLV